MDGEPIDLDDADAVVGRDRDGLLFGLAYAGAHVRQSLGALENAGVQRPDASGTRNLVIVVGTEVAGGAPALRAVSELLEGPPVTIVDRLDSRHPWLGAADMVLVLTADGMELALTESLGVASARGSEVLVVAPEGSAVHQSAATRRARWLPPAGAEPGGAFWSAFTLVAYLGGTSSEALERICDDLDLTAQECGPVSPRSGNVAKVMGEYAAGGRGLVVGEDDVSLSAARLLAAKSLAWAGVPVAVADVRRDERGIERAIVRSHGVAESDIFHDPILDGEPESEGPRLQIMLLAHGPSSGEQRRVAETAQRESVDVVAAIPSADDPVARAAQLFLQAQLAAAYTAVMA